MTALTFEDYSSKPLDGLTGSSEQVLGNAILDNVGAALTEQDLFTKGTYIIAQGLGWAIALHKDPKSRTQYLETRVMLWLQREYEKDFSHRKAIAENAPKGQGPLYDFPVWIAQEAVIKGHELFSPSFEKWLWQNHPNLWFDESRAPKY